MSTPFQLLPALDISQSFAVRPRRGQFDQESARLDPRFVLQEFIHAKTEWVHIVDLDQAFGRGNNQALIAELIAENPGLSFQISGGIRDQETFSLALKSGASRINIASQSFADLAWLKKVVSNNVDRVSFALDVSGALVTPRGTTENFGSFEYVVDYLEDLEVKVICVTDVMSDGMLTGPRIELLEKVASISSASLISSGGVANLNHLQMLIDTPFCAGAIVGKALQIGELDLSQALEISSGR